MLAWTFEGPLDTTLERTSLKGRLSNGAGLAADIQLQRDAKTPLALSRQAGRGVLPYRQSAGRDPRRLAGAARTGQWASDRRGRLEARCGGRLVPRPGPDPERPRRYLRPQRAEGAGRQPGLAPAWRSVELDSPGLSLAEANPGLPLGPVSFRGR
ncbi:hypothetical protein ACPA9J_21825 [Pseudomonas aeruginosa]